MPSRDVKIAGALIALLTGSVAVNMLVLQDSRRGAPMSTSALGNTPDANASMTTGPSSAAMSATAFADPQTPGVAVPAPQLAKAPTADRTANAAEVTRGIQRELNTRGYNAGPPDGVAGQVTRAAILAYEYDFALPLTATPNEDLMSRIVLGSSAPATPAARTNLPVSADAEALVRSVKQQLAALGYQPGKIDGTLSAQLARAVREFELDQKLAETGRISAPFMARLIRLQGERPAQASAQPQVAAGQAGPVASGASSPASHGAKPPAGRAVQR